MERADVLITGIGGFVGGHLAREVTATGATVVGIGRSEPPAELRASGVYFAPCDITDADAVRRVFAEVRPHTVYHLAAHATLTGSTAAQMLAVNVAGTLNVLEACRETSGAVCVVASSDKQYGALTAPPYDDTTDTAFQNGGVYELSKSQSDQTARLFAGLCEVPAVRVARFVNLYGAGDTNYSRIVPGTIKRCIIGEPARITAGRAGAALREYLHVSVAVAALLVLARDASETGNAPHRPAHGKLAYVAFNVAGGERLAAGDLIAAVRACLRDDFGIDSPEPVVQPGAEGVFEPGSQFNFSEKIAALFARRGEVYAPCSLRDGLRETVPWYLDRLRNK